MKAELLKDPLCQSWLKKYPGSLLWSRVLWRGTPPDTPVSQTRDGLSSAGFSPCALSFRLRLHYYSGNNILPSLLCLTARVSFPTLSEFIVGVVQETELHTVVGLETASLYCRTSAKTWKHYKRTSKWAIRMSFVVVNRPKTTKKPRPWLPKTRSLVVSTQKVENAEYLYLF